MKYKQFLSWDLETEHLNLHNNKPWQCGYTLFNHKEVLEQKEYWIWWDDLKLSAGAAFATKFNYEIYNRKANPDFGASTAISQKEFLTKSAFIKHLNDPETATVFQNGFGFDVYILGAMKKRLGFKEDFNYIERSFDTSLICKGLKLGLKPDNDNITSWQYKMYHERTKLKTNLKTLALENGVDYDESRHHVEALYDTELAMQVFNAIKFNLEL